MSLAELSDWCEERFGPHRVDARPEMRRFDIPWLVMDCRLAREVWGWKPQTPLYDILEEIADHAVNRPDWLDLSGVL